MLERLSIRGYRSIREIDLALGPVTILVGENGAGKSNLYQAVKLIQHAARGSLARAIADEGGMSSVLWAGQRDKGSVRLDLEIGLDAWSYHLSLGLPQAQGGTYPTMFPLDPEVKEERLEIEMKGRKTPLRLLDRGRGSATLRDEEGSTHTLPFALAVAESALSQVSDPKRYPELYILRETVSRWRFVHQFRTDPDSPARRESVPVRTWRLADDARDLPCALQTIRENGDDEALDAAIERAFPGTRLFIEDEGGRLHLALAAPGLNRSLTGRELSDGTLRFLCLCAALLSPHPPPLLALNEPESSLHPSLVPALAELCVRAQKKSQLWITTHSQALSDAISESVPITEIRLAKAEGATAVSR